jgi:hypothetical protein
MADTEAELLSLLPSAEQARATLVQAKAERILAEQRIKEKEAADKKALLERLQKPSGVSDAQALKRVTSLVQRAVKNGLSEVEVYRFPSKLCTDLGVAINNQHKGWESTLTGLPKEMYDFWKRHLREKGYRLICQIVDYPGGVLGDVSVTLKWGK